MTADIETKEKNNEFTIGKAEIIIHVWKVHLISNNYANLNIGIFCFVFFLFSARPGGTCL
jgi:hypothetical protein